MIPFYVFFIKQLRHRSYDNAILANIKPLLIQSDDKSYYRSDVQRAWWLRN